MKPGFHKLLAPKGASTAALLITLVSLASGMVRVAGGQDAKAPEKQEDEKSKEVTDPLAGNAAPTAPSADAPDVPDAPPKAISPPEGLKPPFLIDKFTYTEKELEEIASALASVELDFFESAGLRRPMRERATFLAALLRPANDDVVRAFHKLTDTGPASKSPEATNPVGRFKGTEELSLILTLATKAVDSPGASFDDLVLSTHLFDLASKIDSANKDASEHLADLRAAGHRTQWNRIVPSGEDPANTTARPPGATTSKPEQNEKLPLELKRWKNAASAFVISRKNPKSRGSRKALVTANVVKRDTTTVVVPDPAGQPDGRPAVSAKGPKPDRPMEIQMVTEGSFELLQMFASVEGFVESRYQSWPNDRDIEIAFEGGYPADGHSLQEATCALLVDSLLSNRPLDGSVIAYGDLDDRGGILPVEQFPAVISEAAKHFQIGQTLVVGSVGEERIHDALLLYGPEVFLKVDVIAVNHFDKLVEVAESPQLERIVASRRLFHEFQRTAARTRRPDLFLKSAAARKRLSEILKILPDHVSATALSQFARGVQAQKVTIRGTYEYLDWISGTAIYYASKNAAIFRSDHSLQANAGRVAGVRRLRPKFDKQVLPLVDIFIEFGEAVIDYGGITDSNSREGREALRRRSYYNARFHQYLVKLREYVNANPGK